MNTTSATMNRAPSRSGIAWKVTLILIPIVTLGHAAMGAKSRGVSAASADSFFLRHGTPLFSLRIKTGSHLGQRSWPVKFGSRILFTQRARGRAQ